MTRSVKDLRELINISRLSFHGEEEHFNSDERKEFFQNGGDLLLCGDETLTNTCLTSEKDCKEPRTSLRNGRFKPLPAIGSSNTGKKCAKSENIKAKPVKDVEMLYQKSCRCILKHIDGSVVTSWLHRSNESAQWLARWVSAKDFFVWFAKFWLTEMDRQKQKELIEMEVEIILDELEFSVQDGIKSKKVSQHDVMLFFLLIIWEYPSKMCGLQSDIFVLNVLVTLSSGRKDQYRKLLSNVKFATKDAEEIHWILAVRAFALISIITALVKFYSSVMGQLLPINVATDVSGYHSKSLEDFAFDAARLGYLDVLVYLVEEQNLEILELMNDDDLSLLFCAITCNQAEIIKYLLEVDRDVDLKQISKSGNGLLHAAVNTGNPSIVRLLLKAGVDVNQMNTECNGAMPLHLAIMQDSPEIAQLLLDHGAQIHSEGSSDTPLHLAEDLERTDIVEIMKKHNVKM